MDTVGILAKYVVYIVIFITMEANLGRMDSDLFDTYVWLSILTRLNDISVICDNICCVMAIDG